MEASMEVGGSFHGSWWKLSWIKIEKAKQCGGPTPPPPRGKAERDPYVVHVRNGGFPHRLPRTPLETLQPLLQRQAEGASSATFVRVPCWVPWGPPPAGPPLEQAMVSVLKQCG